MVQILHDRPFKSELDIYYNTQFIEPFGLQAVQLIDQRMFRPLLEQSLDIMRLDIIMWTNNEDCMLVWTPENPRNRGG
jgi:hypothetical protein